MLLSSASSHAEVHLEPLRRCEGQTRERCRRLPACGSSWRRRCGERSRWPRCSCRPGATIMCVARWGKAGTRLQRGAAGTTAIAHPTRSWPHAAGLPSQHSISVPAPPWCGSDVRAAAAAHACAVSRQHERGVPGRGQAAAATSAGHHPRMPGARQRLATPRACGLARRRTPSPTKRRAAQLATRRRRCSRARAPRRVAEAEQAEAARAPWR